MDPTEPTREELLELLASLEARTGVRIGPPQVARRYNQLAARVVDLGDGDSQTGVAAIMDSPPYASALGVEGPTLRERVVSVDWATGFGFEPVAVDVGSAADAQRGERIVNARLNSWPMIRIPAEAPESVVQHLNAVDVAQHLADWMRTRITPGADPRAECEPFDWRMARYLLTQRPRAIAEVRGDDGRVRCVVMDNPRARVDRVVPEDVARWRDPKHRAAMTERAREYASHLPGRRA